MKNDSVSLAAKRGVIKMFQTVGLSVRYFDQASHAETEELLAIAARFSDYTMIPEHLYTDNLRLASMVRDVPGEIVECGVWRGGMSAGIATLLGNSRKYWLFDSFEGLPPATPEDGPEAVAYQNDPDGEWYFDNCTAEIGFAREAMQKAGTTNVEIVKGWFKDTVPQAQVGQIALLRLDGDWYESTLTCLEAFAHKVVDGGLIVFDDYHTWDGCSRAVHDYLSRHSSTDRVSQSPAGNAYMLRNPKRR